MAVFQSSGRDRLVDAVVEFLAGPDLVPMPDVRAELEREVDAAGPDAVLTLKARLVEDNGDVPTAVEIGRRLW